MKYLYAAVILCVLCEKFVLVQTSCGMQHDCEIHEWLEWKNCTGACGSQSQIRLREFCCPDAVTPKTVDNCFANCSIPNDEHHTLNQTRNCLHCFHGHTYGTATCKCDPGYKGNCCQGNPNPHPHPKPKTKKNEWRFAW
jgi:hypothetical protein